MVYDLSALGIIADHYLRMVSSGFLFHYFILLYFILHQVILSKYVL